MGRGGIEARLTRDLDDPRLELVKIAFPLSVVWRQGGQANHDRVGPLKRLQRLRALAALLQRIRDLRVRHGDVALPSGVVRIGSCERLHDREAVAI